MDKEDKKDSSCVYDYANKCDCSEDDNCGCTYPNNSELDIDCETKDKKNTDKKD